MLTITKFYALFLFLFFRSTSKQDISYLKQLTLVLMNISTCYWFSLLFYGLPKFIFADHFYIYGHYELYPAVIGKAVLIILITCPLNLGTAHLFRYLLKQFKIYCH